MFNKPQFRTKELSNGLYLAEKKDFLGFYSTLTYSKESKVKDQWIPTTFSSKENAELMIEYIKRYENYVKENDIKQKPFTQIFIDEKDFLNIIGNVKNGLNTISFIKNENSIQKSNDNSLSFINVGTQCYVSKNNIEKYEKEVNNKKEELSFDDDFER